MKKVLMIVLALLMIMSSAGCSEKLESLPAEEIYESAEQELETGKQREQELIETAEDVLYGDLLSCVHHAIGNEAVEELLAQRKGLYAVIIPQETVLECMPGCTIETTEEVTVLAQKYRDKYHLILPDKKMELLITEEIEKMGKGFGKKYIPEEDVALTMRPTEFAEILKVDTLRVSKGAECFLNLGGEEGVAGWDGAVHIEMNEGDLSEIRELSQKDLALMWQKGEKGDDYESVPHGAVVYRLAEKDGLALANGLYMHMQWVPKEWLIPLDFEAMKQELPAGEYVFVTHTDTCSEEQCLRSEVYPKDFLSEEKYGDDPYFFTVKE